VAAGGRVFARAGHESGRVSPVTTEQYYAGKDGIAPRPLRSAMDLGRLEATGFVPRDQLEMLDAYVDSLAGE